MKSSQRGLCFNCGPSRLIGVLSVPESPGARGVLIVTGGPQYRVGSHRQFALLAQALAARGIPALRFDYRGMGDSDGAPTSFDDVHEDIGSAVREFFIQMPALQELVIWGLCDGASAAAFYAPTDPRVRAMVLLNPWVRTSEGAARATLKHYYLRRLGQPDFWHKLTRGAVRPIHAARSLLTQIRAAAHDSTDPARVPVRVFNSLSRFQGRVMLILAGDDLTANEFSDLIDSSPQWRLLASTFHLLRLPNANHTFSRALWRDQVARETAEWILSW